MAVHRVPTGLENQGELEKMLNKIPGLENSGNLKISGFYQGKIGDFQIEREKSEKNQGNWSYMYIVCAL